MVSIINKGVQTRYEDLGHIEEARDRGSSEARKVLDRVYQSSHDDEITRARQKLIDAHKNGDVKRSVDIENRIRDYERSNYGR